MSNCPFHTDQPKLREDLPPMPERIKRLPVGKNGYPIPYFVAETNGSREDFRVADSAKMAKAIRNKLCWVCGDPLGVHMAFVIGPMCTINRVSTDPPAHLDCAVYSAKSCPFLLRPNMVRRGREDDVIKEADGVGGIMIERNPVCAIWVTRKYTLEFGEPGKAPLFRLGAPEAIQWWREGRTATRAEVEESIQSGLPILRGMCFNPRDNAALDEAIKEGRSLLPAR